jgi:hypothetical protein
MFSDVTTISIYSAYKSEGMDRIELAQDRDRWWALVNEVMNLQVPIKCGEFLNWLKNAYILKNDCAPWNK